MTATIYKWNDPGAPQFVDNDTASNVAILKAVLVDGYGSRTPVGGWSVVFEDGPAGIVCFQSSAVDAPVLQITASNQEQGVSGRGFATMSSATVGTGKFPNDTQVTEENYRLPMRSSTTVNPPNNQWYMIVDDDGEYIYFIGIASNTVHANFFFGKLDFSVDAERRWVIAGIIAPTINTTNCDDPLFLNNHSGNYSNIGVAQGSTSGDKLIMTSYSPVIVQPNLIDSRAYFVKKIAEVQTPDYYIGTFPRFLILAGAGNDIFNGQQFLQLAGQKYFFVDTALGNTLIAYDNE